MAQFNVSEREYVKGREEGDSEEKKEKKKEKKQRFLFTIKIFSLIA